MIEETNFWAPLKPTNWEITGGVAQDIWGLLMINDSLGARSYTPASGAILQAVFPRGDAIAGNTTVLTVTKTALLNVDWRAQVQITLTSDDASNITSGTIQFTLTEGSIQTKWNQFYAVKKINTCLSFC